MPVPLRSRPLPMCAVGDATLDGLDLLAGLNGLDCMRGSDAVCDHGHVPDERTPQLPSRRVETALRERIAADEWATGVRLPSVADLATEYGVARGTVTAALRRLAADDLVEIVPAWGTFRR